ncbi:MAG: hypothetical protein KGL39_52080 [Patescibacteria group bacterium]|nr:hypothetical protein [Patescibacteria group bacterium]
MAWQWTRTRERAAALVAEDALTNEAMAAKLKIGFRTLGHWIAAPEFQARVAELVEAARVAVRAESIANKQIRVDRLNARAELLDRVIAERAADESMKSVPGASTGLLVRTYRIANGPTPIIREEYAVDTATLAELRATEKQAAQELGEWVEKSDKQVSGEMLVREYVGVPVEDV